MSLNINYCRLCLQKIEGPAETFSKDSKEFTLVTSLFPVLDTLLVIDAKLCIECFKYAQLANLMIKTVTKNEQKILLDLQNTQLFEKITCRLCLNNEKLDVAFCLFKNTNETARQVIETAVMNLDFDLFRKPVMCNSCWQIVKSIYLFKKKCCATERILKSYCATNGIHSLDRKELQIVSLSYKDKMFSENFDVDKFLFDINARSIANSNLTQNIVDTQNMYLNNLTEDKDNVFKEVPYIANIISGKSESLKEEDEIEIKEENVYERIESNENEGMAANTMNLGSIGSSIKQTEITSNASEIVIIKIENMENNCHSIQKSTSQPVIDTEEMIHDSNDSEHRTHLSLKCEECSYETIEEVNMELHLKTHRSEITILKCSECYYITTYSNSLKKHMETHKSKPKTFKCQKCDYVTRKHSHLVSHISIHQENYNFKCQKCSYQAKRKQYLDRHMLIHQDICNFSCDKCSYRTKRKTDLATHMLIHQENYNFKCEKCSYQAKRKAHLVAHMLIHENNCDVQCNKCSYLARTRSDLASHMLIHQDICNFSCDKCSYQAKRKYHLVSHMLIHQENYNFKCEKCSYRAKKRTYLVKHMVIHQDNCEFSCYKCGYKTKRKATLVSHMLIHQDICNFSCDKCSYRAKRKSDLNKHMSIHQTKTKCIEN